VNSAGLASEPVELAFSIVPPYWERWWFFALIAALITAAIYGAYRYRIAQLQRMQQLRLSAEIDAQEKERRRIARDLHDDLGTRISTLKLYMGGLRGYLVPGEEAREVERNAVEILDESVKDLRNMLNDLSPDTVSRYGYVRAIEELAQHITNSRVIEADVAVAGTPPRLDAARELALYRVTQELFNNSIKHSGCSRMHVRILHDEWRLEVLYEDNGKGMAPSTNGGGHGLRNITNRLQLIGGTITWDSAPGQGLRAIIHVPT
jgi:signal transduction histidine kinase